MGLLLLSCETGVEISPEPGILRITLQSDPSDTFIVVINDTFTVSAGDSFAVTISQGKVYHDDNFAILFTAIESNDFEGTYNILERVNSTYKKYTIYESYVPPNNYNTLQFVANARLVKLKYFRIPVQLPPDAEPLLNFDYDFQLFENKVTEINMQISPFRSVTRYRDSYYFSREMQIVGTTYY